jgi:hypothetical protein
MFVLGRLYYVYVPVLQDMGFTGALILGSTLVLLFMGLGWLYDVRARMWSPQAQAGVERSPFSYVADDRSYAVDYAVFYSVLRTMRGILTKLDIDTESIDDSLHYLSGFFDRGINRKDIFSASPDAEDHSKKHPFIPESDRSRKGVGMSGKAKLAFQTQMLRLTWIQSLTGLFQDVLVFGTFMIALVYFEGADVVTSTVPFDVLIFGIFAISLPLFLFLATLGWLYDRKLQIWSPDLMVKVERNPFTYVAEPRLHIMILPALTVVLSVMRETLLAMKEDTSDIDRFLVYLSKYDQLDVTRDDDMVKARKLRKSHGTIFRIEDRRD